MTDEPDETPVDPPAKKTVKRTVKKAAAPAAEVPAQAPPKKAVKKSAAKAPAKVPAKKTVAKKSPAKKTTAAAKKTGTAKAAPAKTAPAKTAPAKTAAPKVRAAETPPPSGSAPVPVVEAPVEESPVEEVPVGQDTVEEDTVVTPPVTTAVAAEPARPTEPVEPAEPSRRRGLLALVLVTAAVLVVLLVVHLAGGGSDQAQPGGANSGNGTTDGNGDGGGSGADGGVPTPPASAPGQGTYVESTVADDGSVSVRQWIRSSTPIRTLEVAVVNPAQGGDAAATDVKVQALDGDTLATRDEVGSTSVRLELSTSVPNVYLSYRITGGLVDASQTVQGRMLVNVLGMDVDYSGSSGAVQRLVQGPGTVTNAACLRVSEGSDAQPRPCGAPTDDNGWLVTLRGIDRTDRLLAQLDTS